MNKEKKQKTLINISKKTFVQVTLLLVCLLIFSVVLTYFIPKGEFGVFPDGNWDYSKYIPRGDLGGLSPLRALLSPVLVFFSADGLTLLMLSLFLFVISSSFQVMNDVGGIRALVGSLSARFSEKRELLLCLVACLFYCFGSFLGLFEEMLTMLPIVCALCVMLGFDSFTGFICCILACGFGFAGAMTNPFTVPLASEIIGVSPMEHISFRLLIFIVMFGLLLLFLLRYVKKIKTDPAASLTAPHDEALRASASEIVKEAQGGQKDKRLELIYAVFLLAALALIIVSSLSSALRSYSVVVLTAYFLIFGILAGVIAHGDVRFVIKSFLRGLGGALPTIVFIALAASIKYVFVEGHVLPTIVHSLNTLIEGRSPIAVALLIYLVVLLLEFFISSSTAKAILVMGLLAIVNTGLSKPLLVLLYTFGDGYTNVLFPTSPVLLISLSMIEMDYFSWIKKSKWLFLVNFLLVVAFIVLGVVLGY